MKVNWQKRYVLLNIARKRVGLAENEAWRTVLKNVAGVDSIKELNNARFDKLMDHLRSLGFVSDARRRAYNRPDIGDMASAGQVAKIRELWKRCTNGDGTEGGLRTFIKNKTGVSDLRFVDRRGAHVLITALTSWNRHNEKRAAEAIGTAG